MGRTSACGRAGTRMNNLYLHMYVYRLYALFVIMDVCTYIYVYKWTYEKDTSLKVVDDARLKNIRDLPLVRFPTYFLPFVSFPFPSFSFSMPGFSGRETDDSTCAYVRRVLFIFDRQMRTAHIGFCDVLSHFRWGHSWIIYADEATRRNENS